eukprot:TRINITY_DN47211_c0_g1_i1.p1 TRINITY_DN47211_c0_g1~~TRINITY_DN47211_c0_g1_i1.p1  ORF type:complete len:447 (+),score=60.60 TRINITY_DN47211_c0_g1_i1:170-1510(+)
MEGGYAVAASAGPSTAAPDQRQLAGRVAAANTKNSKLSMDGGYAAASAGPCIRRPSSRPASASARTSLRHRIPGDKTDYESISGTGASLQIRSQRIVRPLGVAKPQAAIQKANSLPQMTAVKSNVRRGRIRWNMGPCQHNVWHSAMEKLGLGAEFCTLRQWRGFQCGSSRVVVKMNADYCHDKHQLAKVLREHNEVAKYLPETYLSVEEFVRNAERQDDLWFLKISDVDYGCGVRPFHGPKTVVELQELVSNAQTEAMETLSALRQAKGCKPRCVGEELVIQRAVPNISSDGYKRDLRVYVCCLPQSPHTAFVYRRFGVRRAPKPLDASDSQASQCTHYGHITPAGSADDWPEYTVVFPRLCEAIGCIMENFRHRLEPNCTVLFGMDFICNEQQHPFLLEINHVPRLCYDDHGVQAFTEGMAMDFLRLIVLPEFGSQSEETLWTGV